MVTQDLCGFFVPMGGEIVEDDNRARCDFWNQHFADVGGKCRSIHGPFDDPRSDQCVLCQARDQGLGSPTSERRVHRQALTALGPSTLTREVGLHRRFINEHNTIRTGGNGRQTVFEPIGALLPYLGTAAFGRDQRLFLYVKPSRASRLAMDEWCTRTASASARASRNSKSVMSGSCATSSSRKA